MFYERALHTSCLQRKANSSSSQSPSTSLGSPGPQTPVRAAKKLRYTLIQSRLCCLISFFFYVVSGEVIEKIDTCILFCVQLAI